MQPDYPYLAVPSVDDRDLDLDVENLVLTSVVRSGDGFVVQAVGPFLQARTRVEISVEPHAGQQLTAVVERLQQWCDASTPLRLLAAPGKHLALMSGDGTVIPLPRSA